MMKTTRGTALPFLVACLGVFAFCVMDALMKVLTMELGVYNAMLWRSLAAALLGGAVFVARRGRWPRPAVMRLHLLRGANGTLVALGFFWGIARVPLAEGIAISFVAPLIALYLAAVLLDEKIDLAAILASALGLAGMGTILAGRLSMAFDTEALRGIAAIFVSALFYAWSLILQRQQSLVAGPVEIAFFQNLIVLLLLSLAAPWLAVRPPEAQLVTIGGAALSGLAAVALLSWAYARAQAQVLIPVEYTAFVWAAILGWFVFGEVLGVATVAGTALIVLGCAIANYRPRRARDAVELQTRAP